MINLDFVDGFHDVEENRLKKALPPEYPIDLTHEIEEELRSVSDEMVVFLEDDSTGVQKSHDVYLITDYTFEGLRSGIQTASEASHRLVFILTNSRALSSQSAKLLNRKISEDLIQISSESKITLRIGSRSDSTLRGHFPLEPLVLMETFESSIGRVDGIIVSHAFLTEMSRITVNKIHMLRIMGSDKSFYYRPVHLTKFAEDRRFGYPTSNMTEYVEYKFSNSGLGYIKADDVLHLNLELLRKGGPEGVKNNLLKTKDCRIITVDVFSKRDLQVLTLGLIMAEKCGKNYIYRSAASLPPARVNMEDIPVLNKNDVIRHGGSLGEILCLWGSIVELSNMQLEETLQRVQRMTPISFDVKMVLGSEEEKENIIDLTVNRTEQVLKSGKHALVYTVPRSEYPSEDISNSERASNQQTIAAALQEVYNKLIYNPTVVIFKGGVTSSTGLFNSGSKKVYVLGQISPGIPIVKILPMDNERFPGKEMLMILGPGNVGKADTYVKIVEKLEVE